MPIAEAFADVGSTPTVSTKILNVVPQRGHAAGLKNCRGLKLVGVTRLDISTSVLGA